MTAPKEEAKKIIDALPEDSTYEEIVRELAFDTMIQRGLNDVDVGKVISNKEMENDVAWIEESKKRLEAYKNGTLKTVSCEEVFGN